MPLLSATNSAEAIDTIREDYETDNLFQLI